MSDTLSRKLVIISRTPLRASFCGGGTDIDSFSNSEPSGGRVASLSMDKYVYVTLNPRFDDNIRISYSSLEIVNSIEEIRHDLVREAMLLTGVTSGIEITTIADIPGRGTGLGSSSSVTVGLLHALHCFAGRKVSKAQLAEEACKIEIDILGAPIGRQDQYAAAFGGINSISFNNEGVSVDPIEMNQSTISRINEEFFLIYTGQTRSASEVLRENAVDDEDKLSRLRRIREQADDAVELLENGDLERLGLLLNSAWSLKRGSSGSISNHQIDSLFDKVSELGANGAKLLGAGSGGFLLVHGNSELRSKISSSLGDENRILSVGIDFSGSKIIHANEA